MGLPGQRRSRSSKRRRASHFALRPLKLVACPKCHKQILPHAVCPRCGTYRGRAVVETSAMKRLKRTAKRKKKSSGTSA